MSTEMLTVRQEAQSALSASPLYDLRDLKVEEDGPNRLVMRGTVCSFYHKQLAQEALLAIARPRAYRIVNDVVVVDISPSTEWA